MSNAKSNMSGAHAIQDTLKREDFAVIHENALITAQANIMDFIKIEHIPNLNHTLRFTTQDVNSNSDIACTQ